MKRSILALAALALLASSGTALARGLGVEVWTDRGNEAVYQPGDDMKVRARTSDDAYLLVYEIDTEGYIRVLYPFRGRSEMIEADRTVDVPDPDDDVQLVVQQSVGQSYIVALASYDPFRPLPWYLRPYSAQGEALGYVGDNDDEEGITPEGRIVGDPFVAMERIRRRLLSDPDDDDSFGTSYTSYYVHTEVKYPRYLCYDCHRPNRWAWWDGFDPYYTDCSVFSFRVNWSWYWGPSYWFGHVPYFVYVYRPDCPPRYTRYFESGVWYSAWDGWNRWCEMWGDGGLRRYKTAPPANYIAPQKWKTDAMRLPAERRTPPGFLAGGINNRTRDGAGRLPIGRSRPSREEIRSGDNGRTRWTQDGRIRQPDGRRVPDAREQGDRTGRVQRPERERGDRGATPGYRPREESGRNRETQRREWWRPAPPRQEPRRENNPEREWGRREEQRREERAPERRREERAPEPRPAREWRQPEPRQEPQREQPRVERPRNEPPPRVEPPRNDPPRQEAPRPERGNNAGGRDFPTHKGKR